MVPQPQSAANNALFLSPRSASTHACAHRIERFARDETATILLQGESGTGKTTIARQVHALSPRRTGPLQHVVLSALDDGVAGSELFGHVAGAFTDARSTRAGSFVSANNGTLFLDEIGKASPSIQAKLLHALEYGEIRPIGSDRTVRVNARIIAATNVDLMELVADGAFLPDLYARLATFRVVLPPLRERRADIPGLIDESLRRHARAAGYAEVPQIDPPLMDSLRRASWPNNLRQLDGTIHRLLLEADGAPCITIGHCTDELAYLGDERRSASSITRSQADLAIRASGSISEAARRLGVDRKTLRRIQRDG